MAFNLHSNFAMVAAAESSLNQIINFCTALILNRSCGFGRPVENLKLKVASAILVTIGLMLASDEAPDEIYAGLEESADAGGGAVDGAGTD